MFRTQYTDSKKWSELAVRPRGDESMTVQADARDADINIIMSRYQQTGQLPRVNSLNPEGGDFTAVGDYRDCLTKLQNARDEFASLPAHVRKKFANDPANLLEFLSDPNNAEEAVKLGLTNPKQEPTLDEQNHGLLKDIRDNLANTPKEKT